MNTIPPQVIGTVGLILKEWLQFPMGCAVHDETRLNEILTFWFTGETGGIP